MGIRILLADHHQGMRKNLRKIIDRQPGMEVIAEASTGQLTIQLAESLKPDVVVMEINMRDLMGVDLIRQITTSVPKVKLLALSTYNNEEYLDAMIKAGATGYLLKDKVYEKLVEAIKAVNDNHILL